MKTMYAFVGAAFVLAGAAYMLSNADQDAVAAAPAKDEAVAQKPAPRAPRPNRWFINADTNKDSKLSNAEFHAVHEGYFKKVDANNDGSITQEEMKANRDKERAERQAKKAQNKKPG